MHINSRSFYMYMYGRLLALAPGFVGIGRVQCLKLQRRRCCTYRSARTHNLFYFLLLSFLSHCFALLENRLLPGWQYFFTLLYADSHSIKHIISHSIKHFIEIPLNSPNFHQQTHSQNPKANNLIAKFLSISLFVHIPRDHIQALSCLTYSYLLNYYSSRVITERETFYRSVKKREGWNLNF